MFCAMYYSTNPDSVTTQQNYSKGFQQTELKVLHLWFASLGNNNNNNNNSMITAMKKSPTKFADESLSNTDRNYS